MLKKKKKLFFITFFCLTINKNTNLNNDKNRLVIDKISNIKYFKANIRIVKNDEKHY